MTDVTDVLVAAYQDLDEATKDFDALAALVEAKTVQIEAAILVTHAADGAVNVRQTADHRGRKGGSGAARSASSSGWRRRRYWRRPLSALPRAGDRQVRRTSASRRRCTTRSARTCRPGGAAIIAIFDESSTARRRAGAPRLAREVGRPDRQEGHVKRAEGRARGGNGQVRPRPHRAPDPRQELRRDCWATRWTSRSADWTIIPGPKAPEDAPNVLICLIDDAGFGGPDTFGGGISTPNLTRVGRWGSTTTASTSPRSARRRAPPCSPGRNHHRVGMGSIAELPGPYPGYTGVAAEELHRPAARSCTKTATSPAGSASGI